MTKKPEKILLLLFFFLCLALRLINITQKNLWFDEVFSWHLSIESLYTISVQTANDIHPPLFYFVLKSWNWFLGDSVLAMRLLPALLGSFSVFFVYFISRKVLNSAFSFVVLLLYCISPLNIYYSQEVRMAGMNLFLNLGSMYFLFKMSEAEFNRSFMKGLSEIFRSGVFWGYVLFTSAALYTHYFSFFILSGQVIYIIAVNRKTLNKYIPYLSAFIIIFIIYILWIPVFLEHISRGQSWRSPQTFTRVITEYVNYLKDLNLGLYYHYSDLRIVKYIAIFLGLCWVISIAGMFLKRRIRKDNFILILLVTFVPLILAGVISFKQRVEFYRYLSILVPYLLILLVYGLAGYKHKVITFSLIGLILLINVYGFTIQNSFIFKNDDYRPLIEKLNEEYREGDRIYVEPHYYGWLIDYYKKQESLEIPKTAYIRYGWSEILDSINVQNPQRFWIVLDYSAVDTTFFNQYKAQMDSLYTREFNMTYYMAPLRAELFRYSQK